MLTSSFRYSQFSCTVAGVVCLCIATMIGCGGDRLPRAAMHGKVSVAGAPLAAGRIVFIPQPPLRGPVASAAVVNGTYAIPRQEGPVVGTHRVEIEAELPLGFALDDEAAFAQRGGAPLPNNPIPPTFNLQSQLTTEVRPWDNSYDVAVPANFGPT